MAQQEHNNNKYYVLAFNTIEKLKMSTVSWLSCLAYKICKDGVHFFLTVVYIIFYNKYIFFIINYYFGFTGGGVKTYPLPFCEVSRKSYWLLTWRIENWDLSLLHLQNNWIYLSNIIIVSVCSQTHISNIKVHMTVNTKHFPSSFQTFPSQQPSHSWQKNL